MNYNLDWTNCLLFLTGLNEARGKKCESWKEVIIHYGLGMLRVILITVYIHLTAQMVGLALMGIYLQHSRLPLLVWYYHATVQVISAVQWFLMMGRKDRSNAQLHLMTRILPMKRRKSIRITDFFFSGDYLHPVHVHDHHAFNHSSNTTWWSCSILDHEQIRQQCNLCP